MTSPKMSRRSVLAVAAAAATVAAMPQMSLAQSGGAFSFWLPDGDRLIGDADLKLWAPGGGFYTAMLTITPTQEELNFLLSGVGASHVDFVFEFSGLERTRRHPDTILGGSDHIRYAGAEVVQDDDAFVFIARCFNIEARWEADKPITVTATIAGYRPSGNARPRLAALMAPAEYWHVSEGVEHVYSRTMDGDTKRYARRAVGEPSELLDEDWNMSFRF